MNDARHDPTARLSRIDLDHLLADQRQRSERGESFLVETYVLEQPSLSADGEALLDLIYNEMMLREAHGEKPALDEYLKRFPHLARELSDQFEIEQALHDDTLPVPIKSEPVQREPEQPLPLRSFLDFELLEILGKGGAGVVYKAMQKSLHRIVALKMIRAGGEATLEDRARFRLEAEAVARLQHPNLVQIYEVGEWEGEPYLALEYVDGGTLAQRLAAGPVSALEAARLIETLALAVQHAHAKGIVHRDLKPANVLLQRSAMAGKETNIQMETLLQALGDPAAGEPAPMSACIPKITDFGLAKFVAATTEGLTETGMILGTPAYTAPEQAWGKSREVGPAVDIHALGAILYELLTGQTPFHGPSAFFVIDQVRNQEPVAPSRIAPAVPRDLETICLKCLEKDPLRRYASAQLLAEDLQRFCAGQPIQARPVGRIERAWKWIKRHPAGAGLIGVLVCALLAFGVGGWWSAYEQAKLREEADANFQQAEANFAQAMDAVDFFLDEVGAVELADVPQMDPVRKKLLLKAKGFYDKFLHERGNDPKIRLQAGRGFSRLGTIHELLGESALAEKAYRRAIQILDLSDPSIPQRRERARALNQLAGVLNKVGRIAEAEENVRHALALRKEVAEGAPDDLGTQQDLAASHHELGTILVRLPKRRADANAAYEEALRIQETLCAKSSAPEYRRDMARTLNNLGRSHQHTAPAVAAAKLRRAITTNQELVASYPGVPAYRWELGRNCNNLAAILVNLDKHEAEKKYGEARAHFERLARDFPTVPRYRNELAATHANLGLLQEIVAFQFESTRQPLLAEEAYNLAAQAYEESVRLRRQLVAEAPEVTDYPRGLGNTLTILGNLCERRSQIATAEKHYRDATALLEKLAVPGARAEHFSELGQILNDHAVLRARRGRLVSSASRWGLSVHASVGTPWPVVASANDPAGDLTAALDLTVRAVQLQRSALDADAANANFRQLLSITNGNLSFLALECGNHAIAGAAAQEVLRLSPKKKGNYVNAAEVLARCIPLAQADGHLTAAQQTQLTDSYAEQTITLLRKAISLGFCDDEKELEYLRVRWEYEPLRQRPEFRLLLERAKSNPPVKA